ncbi:MAG TPA: efflux RND transporter periplasmic adaptor subunit [Vicinamibacteria bacterium]|nr:efflux RND transporter periplasmic adaptor subunit [Vicinamibacteria bacterium]
MSKLIRFYAAGAVSALGLSSCKEEAPPPPPPPAVKVAEVLTRDVPIYVEAIGQTRGNTEIEIRARVEGFLETVDFEEGTFVSKGKLLYTIDPRPFEAALSQSKANLARAEAELARAHQDVVRYEPLVAKNAISRQDYETAVAVERAQESAVEAARAAVESAEIDLSYTKVVAPDNGLIGKTEVYPGTLVGRGQSTLLSHISKIDPIHVRFTIAERDYLYYARRQEERRAAESAETPFQLVLADGTVHSQPGRLVFVDRNVDPQTGTILLEASFPNPERIVRPGQYARVRAAVDVKKGAILVSQRSVQELQGIYNVAVVKPDDTVDIRMVTPAERIGTLWVIDSGLNNGERVVVEGLQKVRPGAQVTPETVTIEEGS